MRMGEGLGRVVGCDARDRDPAGQFAEKEFLQDVVAAQETAEDRNTGFGREGRSWGRVILKWWQRHRRCRHRHRVHGLVVFSASHECEN